MDIDYTDNTSDIVSPDYQKGFNEGYLIADHEPDLAEGLLGASGESIYLAGLKDGIEQISLDKDKLPLPKWMNRGLDRDIEKEQDEEIDKDDFEKL